MFLPGTEMVFVAEKGQEYAGRQHQNSFHGDVLFGFDYIRRISRFLYPPPGRWGPKSFPKVCQGAGQSADYLSQRLSLSSLVKHSNKFICNLISLIMLNVLQSYLGWVSRRENGFEDSTNSFGRWLLPWSHNIPPKASLRKMVYCWESLCNNVRGFIRCWRRDRKAQIFCHSCHRGHWLYYWDSDWSMTSKLNHLQQRDLPWDIVLQFVHQARHFLCRRHTGQMCLQETKHWYHLLPTIWPNLSSMRDRVVWLHFCRVGSSIVQTKDGPLWTYRRHWWRCASSRGLWHEIFQTTSWLE